MSGGDWSTNFGFGIADLGILGPSASIGLTDAHSTQEESQDQTRRRSHSKNGNSDDDQALSDATDGPAHQLDRLA